MLGAEKQLGHRQGPQPPSAVQAALPAQHIAHLRTSLAELLVQVMPPPEAEMERKMEAACIKAKEVCAPSLSLSLSLYIRSGFGKFPTRFFLFSPLLSEVLGSGPMERFTRGLRPLFSVSCCVLNVSFGIGLDHNTAKYY